MQELPSKSIIVCSLALKYYFNKDNDIAEL